ncbi:uncharacterized protein I303_106417 [Kwoniella dejecticola CBS 10117]|uniref:Plasma membrane fusion protein PRM1 n=1 Tax=Kwoniella dejecticola CBS 10117 TaxID=1296121 RepID=A0A1A5ZUS2_9TREE|nr:plasma membrane fusion protein PRM1 [Kwoniella dejecticola CBS 10117]OBR81554.1 plasma membrane fusion protein PRM1 [Kwoniella dejecticola CBS 10117]
MSSDPELLRPPQRNHNPNPEHIIPLTPHLRPPFAHYQSSSTLPPTPHTPYSPHPRATSSTHSSSTPTKLRPCLSLSPRILLTFLSPCLLPIILTIAHMINNRQSTASMAASLKQSMFAACGGLAKGAASIQTMPRYLAMQTNEEVIRATQASILAIGSMLMDAVTIIEVVVGFIVDTYRSMLLCTIELAVRGTLEIVIGAVEVITDGITTSLNRIREEIQSDIAGANNLIQSAVSGINHVTSLVNVNLSVPEFSIPSLDFLANVTVPITFEDSLIKLNATLPTLAELKDKMNAILEVPFEALKKEINETRLEIAASFNSSLLPVPSLSSLSSLSANKANDLQNDLCTDLDTSLIDDTAKALHKLSNVAIGLMFLLLFCIWAALAIWEWRKWRTLKNTVEAVEDECRRENTVDAWRMVAIVEHPMLEKYSGNILGRVTRSNRTRTNLRWFLSYLSHPTCLALLFISLLGFLSIQFQLVALDALKAHARENANSTVAASTTSLTAKLNAAAMQSSQEYADQYNAAIAAYQKRIDDELFGSWLNTTAVKLNSTLVEFYDGVEQVLNTTFGGTILFNPINNFMYCILGSKIDNLEKGLTWISEHAHIDLPTLPANILMLSNDSMNEIATPIAAAAVGSSDGEEDEGVVGSLIAHFENALKAERMFYGIMIAMWGVLFFIGLIIVIWNSGGREKYYSIRGISPPQDQHGDTPINATGTGNAMTRWIPWMKEQQQHPIYDTYAEKQFRGTTPTDFTHTQTHNVPRTIEPSSNQDAGEGEKSFFEYPDGAGRTQHAVRPFVPRKGTFGSTMSSLAAPGQAFLKLAGRKLSSTSTSATNAPHLDGQRDDEKLVDRGISSEKYNSTYKYHPYDYADDLNTNNNNDIVKRRGAGAERDQPLWVDRFYGAFEGVKSIFPTRGAKHGAALGRKGSTRTEQSFGASQVPTAFTQDLNWPSHSLSRSQENLNGQLHEGRNNAEWTMVDPQSIGRALDGYDSLGSGIDGRYPSINHNCNSSNQSQNQNGSQIIYPRPMSRAPTIGEGMSLPKSHPFENPFKDQQPPPLPSKHIEDDSHSIDYLQDADTDAEEEMEGESDREERLMSIISPSSMISSTTTTKDYFDSEPRVQVVNKVQVASDSNMGKGRGTMALAGILEELQEKQKQQKRRNEGEGEGEGDVFDDNRRVL